MHPAIHTPMAPWNPLEWAWHPWVYGWRDASWSAALQLPTCAPGFANLP